MMDKVLRMYLIYTNNNCYTTGAGTGESARVMQSLVDAGWVRQIETRPYEGTRLDRGRVRKVVGQQQVWQLTRAGIEALDAAMPDEGIMEQHQRNLLRAKIAASYVRTGGGKRRA